MSIIHISCILLNDAKIKSNIIYKTSYSFGYEGVGMFSQRIYIERAYPVLNSLMEETLI